jgi:hypothetical protein
MRRTFPLFVVLLTLAAATASAKDIYLSIAGSVGNFRTDARIWNPSSTKDIVVSAYFLPVDKDNSAATAVQITIPPRQMKVYDDVVSSLFGGSLVLGGIRLTSTDDFVATSRIYAQTQQGTLGQFIEGLDESSAKTKGVIIQLKSSSAFRTNIGYVNPNNTAATITLRLFDKSNNVVGIPLVKIAPPLSSTNPFNVASLACNARDNAGNCTQAVTADLADAWVSFSSDKPVYAYGSVIDNATTDPTYVPFAEDTDSADDGATGKVFNFVASSFQYVVNPPLAINPGQRVTFRVTNTADITHGFTLVGPDNRTVIGPLDVAPGQTIEKSFTATDGIYTYGCSHVTCGVGHSGMVGSFSVGSDKGDPGPRY